MNEKSMKIWTYLPNKILRRALFALIVTVVALHPIEASAQWYKNFENFGKKTDPLPIVFQQMPTQKELLVVFASRYQSVKQLNTNVTVSMTGMPKIKGDIQIELPNRMRLKAGIMGVSQMGIDFGSNENQFWIWSKASLPGQPPAFYYANHAAFKQSAMHQNIPLDPQWLIDAIGLINPISGDSYHGPFTDNEGLLRFFTIHPTSNGPQIRRTLISPQTGLILQQAIYNSENKLLAYSESSDYKTYSIDQGGRKISLPQKVVLFVEQPNGGREKFAVDLGKFSIDSLFGDPARMWSMPEADGVKKIDLAQVTGQIPPPATISLPNASNVQTRPNYSPNPQPQAGFQPSAYNR